MNANTLAFTPAPGAATFVPGASSAAPAPGSGDAVITASLEEACELREGQLTLYASAHKAQRELMQAARAHRAAQQCAAAAEYLNGESPTLMGIQPSRASRKNNFSTSMFFVCALKSEQRKSSGDTASLPTSHTHGDRHRKDGVDTAPGSGRPGVAIGQPIEIG